MDSITKRHGLRHHLSRLSAVAAVSVTLLAFGLSSVANANTVQTPTGQTFTFVQAGRGVNASGSGFAGGAKIRIAIRYAKTNDLVSSAAQVTATADGRFSVNISVPTSELSRSCSTTLFPIWRYSGTVYARAVQYSSTPQVITPRAETVVAFSTGAHYWC
jgi:hypothetical protein